MRGRETGLTLPHQARRSAVRNGPAVVHASGRSESRAPTTGSLPSTRSWANNPESGLGRGNARNTAASRPSSESSNAGRAAARKRSRASTPAAAWSSERPARRSESRACSSRGASAARSMS